MLYRYIKMLSLKALDYFNPMVVNVLFGVEFLMPERYEQPVDSFPI